jgi:hypothetical protein
VTRAVVAVEVFVEENQVAPVLVALKLFDCAINRSSPAAAAQEDCDCQPLLTTASLPT